jgi:hypothetical protein
VRSLQSHIAGPSPRTSCPRLLGGMLPAFEEAHSGWHASRSWGSMLLKARTRLSSLPGSSRVCPKSRLLRPACDGPTLGRPHPSRVQKAQITSPAQATTKRASLRTSIVIRESKRRNLNRSSHRQSTSFVGMTGGRCFMQIARHFLQTDSSAHSPCLPIESLFHRSAESLFSPKGLIVSSRGWRRLCDDTPGKDAKVIRPRRGRRSHRLIRTPNAPFALRTRSLRATLQVAKKKPHMKSSRRFPGVSLEDSLHPPATGDQAFGLQTPRARMQAAQRPVCKRSGYRRYDNLWHCTTTPTASKTRQSVARASFMRRRLLPPKETH